MTFARFVGLRVAGRAGEADLIGDSRQCGCTNTEASLVDPASTLTTNQEARMIVGIDVHKHSHAAALLDERGGEIATLTLNARIKALDAEIAELLEEHGNPLADLQGAGTNLAATIISQAGDVRRFRGAGAFARYCGAAPIPCGSGQTAGRHRLHRGGNRQLNAALYRIAIVQARHHPQARAYLARKASEGKTPREARRALKRHLANVLYRRLYAWAEQAPAMQT
ncbi:MAG TPA: transposase [Solirubrobacterales bacterium]|nr:transposase [Solirubrobacterales bacterium]